MPIGKPQVCAFGLGLVSAVSIVVVVVCLKSNSTVWALGSTSKASTLIRTRDAADEEYQLLYGTNKIPHILHQSWVNNSVPEHYSTWRQSWVKNHQHWEFKLWTDADNDALVRQYMPWFLARYEEYDEPVMRADAVRYLYMHKYGGVYADLDFESLKPLDPLLEDGQVLLGTLGRNSPPEHSIPNSFMASAPGHPFWMFCFAKMLSANLANRVGSFVETVTGPIMLKQALDEYRRRQEQDRVTHDGDVVVLPQELVYPIVWSDPMTHYPDCNWGASDFSSDACHRHFEDAYAVTYWAHGWR